METLGEMWERFRSNVDARGREECWEWRGTKNGAGYGCFYTGGKVYMAHRMAYMIEIGDIEDDLLICHTCDNKSCVNPNHLWKGTRSENAQDCSSKDGQNKKGERNGNSKLTKEDVVEIRRLKSEGYPNRYITNKFGIDRRHIPRLMSGKEWKHV
jgi:hypothetical protein